MMIFIVGKYKGLRTVLGCAAHFRFDLKRGKCERKSFRLESKRILAKPALPRVRCSFSFSFEIMSSKTVSLGNKKMSSETGAP